MTQTEDEAFDARTQRDVNELERADTIPCGPPEALEKMLDRQLQLDLHNGNGMDRVPDTERIVHNAARSDRKAIPLASGCVDYFPDALKLVAQLSRIGNDKHNPGQPMHWAQDKSNDHADCMLRHQTDVGTTDPESGLDHAVAVVWRALAQLQMQCQARGAKMPKGAK